MRHLRFCAFGAVLCLTLAGCGSGERRVAKASGVVLLDGNPIAGANVALLPAEPGAAATAVTDKDGKFSLTTKKQGDGAVVGKHRVTIMLRKYSGKLGEDIADADGNSISFAEEAIQNVETPEYEWVVPERYSHPDFSGLTCEVPAGGSTSLKFELTSMK